MRHIDLRLKNDWPKLKWAKRIDIWISKRLHWAIRTMMKEQCKRTQKKSSKRGREKMKDPSAMCAHATHPVNLRSKRALARTNNNNKNHKRNIKSSPRRNKIIFLAVYFHIFSCKCVFLFSFLFFCFAVMFLCCNAISFHCLEYDITA